MLKKEIEIFEEIYLKKSLQLHYPHLKPHIINSLLKTKNIKVNGKKQSENILLKNGDKVEFYITEENFRKPKLDIIYCDDNLLIINKPKKIETKSDNSNIYTLEKAVQELFPSAKALHRLDTNTSGLVIFSLNEKTYLELLEAFKNQYIEKNYACIVSSENIKNQDSLKNVIIKSANNSKVKVDEFGKTGLTAELDYTCIERDDKLALIEVKLKTGRTHQIRAQLAYNKIFVLGDGKYGDKNLNKKFKANSQFLIAYSLSFKLPMTSFLSYLNNKTFKLPVKFKVFEKIFKVFEEI